MTQQSQIDTHTLYTYIYIHTHPYIEYFETVISSIHTWTTYSSSSTVDFQQSEMIFKFALIVELLQGSGHSVLNVIIIHVAQYITVRTCADNLSSRSFGRREEKME